MARSDHEPTIPPTVPITGVNVPDPTTGSEPESKYSVAKVQKEPNNPDKAAEDSSA